MINCENRTRCAVEETGINSVKPSIIPKKIALKISKEYTIYDGVFLMSLIIFEEYPLDKLSLIGTMLNPIDLSRTLILLKLDISALLGYTGAVFKQFFGTNFGLVVSFISLSLWVIFPVFRIVFKSKRKDF